MFYPDATLGNFPDIYSNPPNERLAKSGDIIPKHKTEKVGTVSMKRLDYFVSFPSSWLEKLNSFGRVRIVGVFIFGDKGIRILLLVKVAL